MATVLVWSCNDDDDSPTIEPPKPLNEVIDRDNDSIQKYIETHFYNYEDFSNPPADFDYKIVLGKIEGDNADKRPLSDMVKPKKVIVRSREIGIDNDKELEHTYYYLVARQGTGESVTVADSTYIRYEGSLLNDIVFDDSTTTPIWFDLADIQKPGFINRSGLLQKAARGFSEGISNFKAGNDIVISDASDGTYKINGYGVGLIIIPSALGYYSAEVGTIPSYSPLLFKIDLMRMNEADHDNDGVPSYSEDINGNGYLYDDNTDKKAEENIRTAPIPNFLDADDDNDGKLTIYEIKVDGKIIFPYPDTDNDGTPDYLDSDN